MQLTPKIETISAKKCIGKRLTMSFAENKTAELWKSFMPRRKEITNHVSDDLISMQVYAPAFNFNQLDVNAPFDKWACKEVIDFDSIPIEMETISIPAGLYAVFLYKGLNTDTSIFQNIFGSWLPNSNYLLDNRPHFEILGEKYKNNDPNSEEEIWIPIQPKR